jgi:hypothetical protein
VFIFASLHAGSMDQTDTPVGTNPEGGAANAESIKNRKKRRFEILLSTKGSRKIRRNAAIQKTVAARNPYVQSGL